MNSSTVAIACCIVGTAAFMYAKSSSRRKREFEAPAFGNQFPLQATMEFGKDADAFLQACADKFGPTFSIYLGSEYTVFVTDVNDHSAVMKCRDISFDPAMKMFEMRAAATSQHGIDIAYDPDNLKRSHAGIRSIQNSASVEIFLRRGIPILNARFDELPVSNGSLDLYPWINDVIFEAATRVCYGDCYYSPELKPDFDEWSGNFSLLMAGFPAWLFPKTQKAMNRLSQSFADGLEDHFFQDASDFVKERVKDKRDTGLTLSDQAKSNLGILLAANSNLIPSAFWTVYYIYHKDQAKVLEQVKEELATHLDLSDSSTWTREALEKCTLLNSCIYESVRLTSGSFPLRIALQDTVLDLPSGPVSLLKGDQVMLVGSSRWTHEKGQEFVADRFLTKQPNMPLFGFGSHMCTGRFFAINFIKTLVANMVLRFKNVELDYEKEPIKDMSKVGQGIYPPVGSVELRYSSM